MQGFDRNHIRACTTRQLREHIMQVLKKSDQWSWQRCDQTKFTTDGQTNARRSQYGFINLRWKVCDRHMIFYCDYINCFDTGKGKLFKSFRGILLTIFKCPNFRRAITPEK